MKKIISFILTLVTVLTLTFTLTACKGDEPVENNNVDSKAIGTSFMISNGLVDIAANDQHTVVDSVTSIAYTVYLASETKYGEGSDLIKLAKYDILQPTNADWVTVFDKDVDFDGVKMTTCNLIDLDKETIRVFITNQVDYKYYYRDVNKKTFELGAVKEVKYKKAYKSEPVTMDKENINAHIKELGGQEFEFIQFSSEIINVDRTFYTAVSGGATGIKNFLFMKSTDGETWSFVSMANCTVSYEAMLVYHDYKFYVMCRNGGTHPGDETQQNLYYSEDNGKTWKQSNLALNTSDTRPFLFNYQGELYLAYSSPLDLEYSTIRPWRCNVHVGKIVSNNGVETFEEVLYKESKYGIVYYSLIDCYGKMIMIYSSGELHPEEGTMGGYTQGKDCLMYTILQEQDPILEIKR